MLHKPQSHLAWNSIATKHNHWSRNKQWYTISCFENDAAEARDEHVTELDIVLYIIIALVDIKTSYYL